MAENETPVAPVTVAPVTPTTPFAVPDDAIVEVVVRGEKVLKPWKEARAGIQMQEDYTRSKQEVSKQAKEIKDIYDHLTERQRAIAEREAALDAVLGRTTRQEKKGPEPDEVITYAQLQDLRNEWEKDHETKLQSMREELSGSFSTQRQIEKWEDLTSKATESLVKEHPVLKRIPELESVLKKQAAKDKPTTEQEMVQAIVKAGKDLATSIDADYSERRKAELARKQELVKKGPESAGGAPVFKAPEKDYRKGSRKIDWDAVEKDALSAVEALEE